jgi:hypothetical protein
MDAGLLALRLLLTLLLFAFLAALGVLLWQDLRRAAAGRGGVPHPDARLVVIEAGQTALEPGMTFPLQEVTSLGRTPANGIVLNDPFVSTHHALISWREAHWWLEDLGSKNGTTLNGEPIGRPTVVSAGDLIGLGQVVLRLEEATA